MTYRVDELRGQVPDEMLALRIERKRKKLTQREVAQACGVREDTYARWEIGERPAKPEQVAHVRRVLAGFSEYVDIRVQLREYRTRLNLGTFEAAAMAGIPERAWQNLENRGHKSTRRFKYRAQVDALLARWEGRAA